MQTEPVSVLDEEAVRVFHWRVRRFRGLGFTLWQSRRLAEVQADWHEAEALLAAERKLCSLPGARSSSSSTC